MCRGSALLVVAILATVSLFSAFSPLAATEAPKPEPGAIFTVAGTGRPGYSGDGGPAGQAGLNQPHGLAVDAQGNLFIADVQNNRIRKVAPDGMITTVAGAGKAGYAGDGGRASEALLSGPLFVALSGSGDLFIADHGNNRVRKVSTEELITTVVGNGTSGYSGDGGPAAAAAFGEVVGLALDPLENLFVADPADYRVREVGAQGTVTTVAGNGKSGSDGDGGRAVEARLNRPDGVATDQSGNLFIADFYAHVIRKVDGNGVITTVAGTGQPGFSGDGGLATAAQLQNPFAVVVDSAGELFIGDWGNYRVRKVDSKGIITTVVGNGTERYTGEGGPATATGIRGPNGLVIDAEGNLFFSQSGIFRNDGLGDDERVLKVFGLAAPGLIAGQPFPKPSPKR